NMSFFFSSRRRHTRFSRDWSSDVCSSDLQQLVTSLQTRIAHQDQQIQAQAQQLQAQSQSLAQITVAPASATTVPVAVAPAVKLRSEERRVGKECRSRWSSEPARSTEENHT